MSPQNVRSFASLNATSVTTAIRATATASTTTSSPAVTHIGDPMREEAMDVVVAKIISLLILTILSVLCGLLPLRLLLHAPHLLTRNRNSVDYLLCCLRLFSGGIYLATCFLHLMPDTQVKIGTVMKNLGSQTEYAVPELLIMSGFYTVVFVEQIIQVLYVKALESDVNRKREKEAKAKAKPDSETKQSVQVFRSTIDEEIARSCNHVDRRTCTDDEDDDEDNVLIEDEDDLSFRDGDSDRKSLDSVTQVKEGHLESPSDAEREKMSNHRSTHHVQLIPNHNIGLGTKSEQLQYQQFNHSRPSSYEVSNNTMKTFSRSSLGAFSKTPSGPPILHTQAQQHATSNGLKQNHSHHKYQANHINHYHPLQNHQNSRQEQQQHPLRSSSFPPPQQIQTPFQKGQQAQNSAQQPLNSCDSPFSRTMAEYPTDTHSSDEESPDDEESNLPNNFCPVSVSVEGVSSEDADTTEYQSRDSNQSRNVDSGVYFDRRDCEVSDTRTLNHIPSKEVSFERISESSSILQDIHVKRVVDELSRTGDSSKAHFRSIIYIMALSFHGIFEGMALGLQSMKSSVWALCFAIVVHRCVLAFKLGMDLCRGEEKQGTTFLCIGMLTLISTLGIIIGIVISSGAFLYSDVTVPEAILQSLSTGTIFYIVFFDILFKDLEGKDDLKRVSCSFVGFSLMAIVFAITRS